MNQIQAIIFDMDGVLVDAKQWHFDALNHALELFGYRISQFENEQRFDGLPTRDKLKMLSNDHGLPPSLHSFINEMKQQYTLEIAAEFCVPNQQHLDCLSRLQADGYQLALASNSIRKSVDVLTERTCVQPFLEFMLSNEDVSQPKPNAEIYQLATSKLELSADQCLVVEDGEYGIKAATLAGNHVMRVGGVHDVTYGRICRRIAEIENARDLQGVTRRAA